MTATCACYSRTEHLQVSVRPSHLYGRQLAHVQARLQTWDGLDKSVSLSLNSREGTNQTYATMPTSSTKDCATMTMAATSQPEGKVSARGSTTKEL